MVQIWTDQCGSSRHGPANMKLVHTCLYKLIPPPHPPLAVNYIFQNMENIDRSLPQLSGNKNELPESLISSSELSDDSVSKFTSLVRARD